MRGGFIGCEMPREKVYIESMFLATVANRRNLTSSMSYVYDASMGLAWSLSCSLVRALPTSACACMHAGMYALMDVFKYSCLGV